MKADLHNGDIELLKEFIEWAEANAPDAWWVYEHPDEAIRKFIQQLETKK